MVDPPRSALYLLGQCLWWDWEGGGLLGGEGVVIEYWEVLSWPGGVLTSGCFVMWPWNCDATKTHVTHVNRRFGAHVCALYVRLNVLSACVANARIIYIYISFYVCTYWCMFVCVNISFLCEFLKWDWVDSPFLPPRLTGVVTVDWESEWPCCLGGSSCIMGLFHTD